MMICICPSFLSTPTQRRHAVERCKQCLIEASRTLYNKEQQRHCTMRSMLFFHIWHLTICLNIYGVSRTVFNIGAYWAIINALWIRFADGKQVLYIFNYTPSTYCPGVNKPLPLRHVKSSLSSHYWSLQLTRLQTSLPVQWKRHRTNREAMV